MSAAESERVADHPDAEAYIDDDEFVIHECGNPSGWVSSPDTMEVRR